jgi:hypothetical protein
MTERPTLILHVQSRFPLGGLNATSGAVQRLSPADMQTALNAHASGQWGDLDADDLRANEQALEHGGRLVSAYSSEQGTRFYVITEADRSYTTILLPSEY